MGLMLPHQCKWKIQNPRLKTQNKGTMMMRVVNFEAFCRSIQVPEEGNNDLILKLIDTQCPWNEGNFSVHSNNGELNIERVDKSRSVEITLDPFQLSTVVGGLTAPSVLQEMRIISCSQETAKKLENLFPVDSFYSYFRF